MVHLPIYGIFFFRLSLPFTYSSPFLTPPPPSLPHSHPPFLTPPPPPLPHSHPPFLTPPLPPFSLPPSLPHSRPSSPLPRSLPRNSSKCRPSAPLPPAHSRVKLQLVFEEVGSDFINASYLGRPSFPREFVITQLPLRETVSDFWRCGSHHCHMIVYSYHTSIM